MDPENPTIDEVEAAMPEEEVQDPPDKPSAGASTQSPAALLEEVPKPAPKKRGRPPKVVEEPEEAPAPKRRGRPPKVVEESSEEPPPAPKKRGRPPKEVEPQRPVRRASPGASLLQAPELDYREITRHLAMHLADEKFTRRQAKVDSWNQFFE